MQEGGWLDLLTFVGSEALRAYFGPVELLDPEDDLSSVNIADATASIFSVPATDVFGDFISQRWGTFENFTFALVDGADAMDDLARMLTFLADVEGYPSSTRFTSLGDSA